MHLNSNMANLWIRYRGGAKSNCHVTNFQSQNSASIYRRKPLLGQNAIHEFRSLTPFKEPWKSINSAMPHAIRYGLDLWKSMEKPRLPSFFFFSMFACCWGLIYSLKLPRLKLLPCCGRHLNRQDTPLFPRGPTRMTCQGAFWGLRSTRSQSTSLVMPEAEPHNQCMMSGKVPKHWTFKTHKGVYAERCLMQFRICLEFNPKWTPMQSALPFEERICWRVLLYWDRADPCMRSMFQNIGSFGNFGISMNSWTIRILPHTSHLWEFKNLVKLCRITTFR